MSFITRFERELCEFRMLTKLWFSIKDLIFLFRRRQPNTDNATGTGMNSKNVISHDFSVFTHVLGQGKILPGEIFPCLQASLALQPMPLIWIAPRRTYCKYYLLMKYMRVC